MKPKKDNLITKIEEWGPTFSIKFEIKILSEEDEEREILRL